MAEADFNHKLKIALKGEAKKLHAEKIILSHYIEQLIAIHVID
jgi:hypothetical protein